MTVLVRRIMVVALVGAGAAVSLALAHLARPSRSNNDVAEELSVQCESIREGGEETPGELSTCLARLAHVRAEERR
jgi:hypothetical protein